MQVKCSHLPDAFQLFPCMQKKEDHYQQCILQISAYLLSITKEPCLLFHHDSIPKDTAFIPEAVLKKQHAFFPNLNYCVHTSASHFSRCMQSWQCHPTLPVLTFLGLLPTDKGKKPYPTVTEPSVMTRTVEFCTAFTITSGLPARSTHFPFSVTDLTSANYLQ